MLTEQEVDELLGINETTKRDIWKARLEEGFNNVVGIMILLCTFAGIETMGWKVFWVTLLLVVLLEVIIVTVKHIYHLIKRCVKNRK